MVINIRFTLYIGHKHTHTHSLKFLCSAVYLEAAWQFPNSDAVLGKSESNWCPCVYSVLKEVQLKISDFIFNNVRGKKKLP